MVKFLQEAAHVVPSKRQLDWYELESYAFIHFGVNTFTNREWGEGTEPESVFNPENLDCESVGGSYQGSRHEGNGADCKASRRFLYVPYSHPPTIIHTMPPPASATS